MSQLDPSVKLNQSFLDNFANMYRTHCVGIFNAVVQLDFASIEQIWQTFWAPLACSKIRREVSQVFDIFCSVFAYFTIEQSSTSKLCTNLRS